jgi:5-methylcytosine-specific restriction endonuclease McrA
MIVSAVLERPTLVLNRNWQPINVATVARALVMVWNDTARVVDPIDYQTYEWADWARLAPDEGEPFVRAVTCRLRVPEVITLLIYDHMPSATVAFSRRNVFKRDHYACKYCGRQPGANELTIDHVIPRAQGGQSTWTNCVLACIDCNRRKADRTPEQAQMRLRGVPKCPTWRPLYTQKEQRVESWSKFFSDAYWNAELQR